MTEQTAELTFLKSSRKRRIAAFLIDHFVLTFLMVSIVFIALGPNFMDENNPSKMMTSGYAKATYVKANKNWKVYWKRADQKWHQYEPKPTVSSLSHFLKLVDEDKYACFKG